jgi:hypothetical protein
MKPIKTPTFILPRLLRLGALVLAIACGVGYGVWQGRFLIMGPEITINNPPAQVQSGRTVTLTGTAENATKLYLNGRPIVTDQSGVFTEAVVLENGHTIVGLDAHDRYGRVTRWEQSLVLVEENAVAGRNQGEGERTGL